MHEIRTDKFGKDIILFFLQILEFVPFYIYFGFDFPVSAYNMCHLIWIECEKWEEKGKMKIIC